MSRRDVIVLDIEIQRNPDDCINCGQEKEAHLSYDANTFWCGGVGAESTRFSPIGWTNKALLGISVGCFWSYARGRLVWFDEYTLEATMRVLVAVQPWMVSFNGITFDYAVMRAILRHEANSLALARACKVPPEPDVAETHAPCDQFKALAASSFDLLAAVWQADPRSRMVGGLNSLDALCRANDLGATLESGAMMPRLWQEGQVARVMNHCSDDVYHTRDLFELVMEQGVLQRVDGTAVTLERPPGLVALWHAWGRGHVESEPIL
jgi:hypothetical protein